MYLLGSVSKQTKLFKICSKYLSSCYYFDSQGLTVLDPVPEYYSVKHSVLDILFVWRHSLQFPVYVIYALPRPQMAVSL